MGHLGIKTVGDVRTSTDCDFSGLSSAIIIAHVVLPLACLPLTFVLIPSWQMNDADSFDVASPAPSFASPAPSPPSSPRGSQVSADSTPASPMFQESPLYPNIDDCHLPLLGGEQEKRSFVLSGLEAADFVSRESSPAAK